MRRRNSYCCAERDTRGLTKPAERDKEGKRAEERPQRINNNNNTNTPTTYLTYAHYHTNTAKFPNHNVGVPSAGSLYKSESSFVPQMT